MTLHFGAETWETVKTIKRHCQSGKLTVANADNKNDQADWTDKEEAEGNMSFDNQAAESFWRGGEQTTSGLWQTPWDILSTKEDSSTDLDKDNEDATPMDELEKEIASAQDYQERILLWKARASRVIQRERDTVSVRVRKLYRYCCSQAPV